MINLLYLNSYSIVVYAQDKYMPIKRTEIGLLY